ALAGGAGDAVEDVAHHAKGAQGEEVDLHESQRLDVLLVELGDHPTGHRGTLDGDQVDEGSPRHQHAADVDPKVAREAIDLGAECQQPLPSVARQRVQGGAELRAGFLVAERRRITSSTPRAPVCAVWRSLITLGASRAPKGVIWRSCSTRRNRRSGLASEA